jgi:hypothetical protein
VRCLNSTKCCCSRHLARRQSRSNQSEGACRQPGACLAAAASLDYPPRHCRRRHSAHACPAHNIQDHVTTSTKQQRKGHQRHWSGHRSSFLGSCMPRTAKHLRDGNAPQRSQCCVGADAEAAQCVCERYCCRRTALRWHAVLLHIGTRCQGRIAVQEACGCLPPLNSSCSRGTLPSPEPRYH